MNIINMVTITIFQNTQLFDWDFWQLCKGGLITTTPDEDPLDYILIFAIDVVNTWVVFADDIDDIIYIVFMTVSTLWILWTIMTPDPDDDDEDKDKPKMDKYVEHSFEKDGTPVTVDTFNLWWAEFKAELDKNKEKVAESSTLTGKEFFARGGSTALVAPDESGEKGTEIDWELFTEETEFADVPASDEDEDNDNDNDNDVEDDTVIHINQ